MFIGRLDQAKLDWCKAVDQLYAAMLCEIASVSKAPTTTTSAPKADNLKPGSVEPKLARQGNRWIVEKGRNWQQPVVITPDGLNESVLVEDCENVSIQIKGKVAAISTSRHTTFDWSRTDGGHV